MDLAVVELAKAPETDLAVVELAKAPADQRIMSKLHYRGTSRADGWFRRRRSQCRVGFPEFVIAGSAHYAGDDHHAQRRCVDEPAAIVGHHRSDR
jgi:hypothetical protein